MPDMISSQFRESKLLIGILVVISAIIITFSYFNYKENANHTQFFESEKEFLKQELLTLQKAIEAHHGDNSPYTAQWITLSSQVELLIDSLNNIHIDPSLLIKYRNRFAVFRDHKVRLEKLSDSLRISNQFLYSPSDINNLRLVRQVEGLQNSTKRITDTVSLSFSNPTVTPYKVRLNGNLLEPNRAARTNKLRYCFSISGNTRNPIPEHLVYIQIINPKGIIMGAQEEITYQHTSIVYSDIVQFEYQVGTLSLCEALHLSEKALPGTYKIHLFYQGKMVSTSQFTLE